MGICPGSAPRGRRYPSCMEKTVQPSAEHKGEIHARCLDEGWQPLDVTINLYLMTVTVTQHYSLSSKYCVELM